MPAFCYPVFTITWKKIFCGYSHLKKKIPPGSKWSYQVCLIWKWGLTCCYWCCCFFTYCSMRGALASWWWCSTASVVPDTVVVVKKTFGKKATHRVFTTPTPPWWSFSVDLTAIFQIEVSTRKTTSSMIHQLICWKEFSSVDYKGSDQWPNWMNLCSCCKQQLRFLLIVLQ